MTLSPVHHTSARDGSGSDVWLTPLHVVTAIEQRLDCRFGMDVATDPGNGILTRMRAAGINRPGVEYTQADDGLSQPWDAAAVWCNPPYSDCAAWLARARDESRRCGNLIVCLVPARTDTQWWATCVMHPQQIPIGVREVLLIVGRVSFSGAGPAPFPSAVIVYDGANSQPVITTWIAAPIQETLL